MNFSLADILLIITIVLALAVIGFYFYNRKNYKKMVEARQFVENNKMTVSIFVIDKKYEKPTEKNITKQIYERLPKVSKFRRMPIVKAKVGPQIATLICDKNVYDALTPKKSVKVELSGVYIVNVVGLNLENKKKKTIGERVTLYLNKSK